jgi:citrate lyase subunit beta/citryl-CoA lyase
MQLRRVQLASPGSNLRMLERGSESNADHVFLDLEDSVAPNQKVESRGIVVKALNDFDWSGKIACVRVNGLDTEWFYGDLIEVVEGAGKHLDTIMLPKANRAADVYMLDTMLAQIETHNGLEVGRIGIEAQIEMAEGMVNVNETAFASPRLQSLIFGPGDYSASVQARGLSIGASDRYPGHVWHYAIHRIVVAARAANLQVTDGPFADYKNLDAYRHSCEMALALGCDGKWAIHPDQIDVAIDVFSPSMADVEKARRIVVEYTKALESGQGAIAIDGDMVDAATLKMAEIVAAKAEAAGL